MKKYKIGFGWIGEGNRQGLSLLLALLTFAMALVGCGGSAPAPEEPAAKTQAPAEDATQEESADGQEPAATSDRCGDKSKLADTLNFFNWSDYIDEDILTQFEQECGVKVVQDMFSSNEDMIAKVQAGNSGYDLVVPSDYAIEIMVNRDMLAELDTSNIPNMKNLNPKLMGLYYDPDNKYSLPYQWGTTGIAYNVNEFPEPPDSWAVLFDFDQVCKHSGFVSMLDDEREALGAALMYLGYSPNDTDPEHHKEAKKLLLGQKNCLAAYDSDNFANTLASEEIYLANSWSGGVATARAENENIAYFIPKEGGVIWQDNLAIPSDAPNKYTAEVFINYLLDPEIGAQLTNYTYYFTPNKESEALLDQEYYELLESGGMLVDDEIYSRLKWIKRNNKSMIFSDTWTGVKAQ